MTGYDPTRCDLCGSTETRTLLSYQKSMTSDSRVVATSLEKVGCLGCGLVRNGQPMSEPDLAAHYGFGYKLGEQAAAAEPVVFTDEGGAVPRSELMAEAVAWAAAEAGVGPGSVLEVGCGEGLLLDRLARRWRAAAVAGLDLGAESVELARRRGLDVSLGSYEDAKGPIDLIVSIAVIEHVPSPREFLRTLGGALADDGALVVAEPVQGGNSFDLFFSDHLHHFSPWHISALGGEEGLVEVAARTLAPAYPDFALHAFRRAPGAKAALPRAEEVLAAVEAQARRWQEVFDRVNTWLAGQDAREIAVWGLGQAYTLLLAYSDLDEGRVAVRLDDNPDRFASGRPFPVTTLEGWLAQGGEPLPVLLAFPPSAAVRARLESSGVDFHAPFIRHDR